MVQYRIKKIGLKWILTTMSAIFATVGLVIGVFMFFFFPIEEAAELEFAVKLGACVGFMIGYTLISVVGILVTVWLYNIFSPKTGSITFFAEVKEEDRLEK